jgi:hypothetical protein
MPRFTEINTTKQDLRRLRLAYDAQMRQDPDNLVALAMIGRDMANAEQRWRAALSELDTVMIGEDDRDVMFPLEPAGRPAAESPLPEFAHPLVQLLR